MFPNLRAKDVAGIVKEEYLRAQLEVEVDDAELALFLSIEVSREELERLGLGEVTNTRKRRGGRPILHNSQQNGLWGKEVARLKTCSTKLREARLQWRGEKCLLFF